MRKTTTRKPAERLRSAVECMPLETKRAMLDGIEGNEIIVGAYVDDEGGVCPMLAAHRNGGRTNFATFAKAWDRYTGARRRARRASRRELRTLVSMLEASIEGDAGIRTPLSEAVAEHRDLVARRAASEPVEAAKVESTRRSWLRDSGERHRGRELRGRHGWSWLRVFRRYDEYEAALEQLENENPQNAVPAERSDAHRERELV